MTTLRMLLPGALVTTCLYAPPAWAQEEDLDAPISTAPLRYEVEAVIEGPAPDPITLPPATDSNRPWIEPRADPRTCEQVRSLGMQRGRELHGVDMALGELVSESSYRRGCDFLGGHASLEIGTVMLVTEKGKFGSRGLPEELRLQFDYRDEFHLPYGVVDMTLFATIRAYDVTQKFESYSDDYSTLGFTFGYSFWIDDVKVRPVFITSEKWNPINYLNSQHRWGLGHEIDTPFLFGGRFNLTGATIRSENSTTANVHKHATYAIASARWHFRYGLEVALGVRYDRYGKHDAQFLKCVDRDMRIRLCGLRNDSTPLPQFGPFVRFSQTTVFW